MTTVKGVKPLRKRLSNGLTVVFLHTPTDPVSACHLFIPVGASHEPDARSGIGTLTWSLITKGTARRNARQYAESVEAIGASVSAGVTHDYSEISCHAIADYMPGALELMAEALFEPSFSPEEVVKERTALVAAIRSKKESIFTVANEELNKRIYGQHPYGRPATGNEKTVSGLDHKDLKRWHKSIVVPAGSVLSLANSRPASEMMPMIERLFGAKAWPRSAASGLTRVGKAVPLADTHRSVINERFEQAYLLIGYVAPSVLAKDYLALKVLNAVLGGGMSARLFQQLREKQGLAYDVGSFYPSKLHGSAFVAYMGLQKEKLEAAKKGMLSAFLEVLQKPVPKQELEQTKAFLKGTFILDHQTNSQRAHYVGWWEVLGLGHQFDARYLAGLESVTPARVQAVAKSVLGKPPVFVEIHPRERSSNGKVPTT